MMKRFYTLLLLMVVVLNASFAQVLTPEQRKAKTEIFSYLNKYATNVLENRSDLLSFSFNDIRYYINIGSEPDGPLYLIVGANFTLTNEYDDDLASRAAFEAASNKPVFSVCIDRNVYFNCEMYARKAKPFIDVLPDMIKAINLSAGKFEQEYQKLVKTLPQKKDQQKQSPYVGLSHKFAASQDEYHFPYGEAINDKGIYVSKVYWEGAYTVLEMISYNGGKYQWCSIDRMSCLTVNDHKYYLMKAEGIQYAPNHTDYPDYQSRKNVSLTFRLYFSAIPKTTRTFDFSESSYDGWAVRNITLDNAKIIDVANGQTVYTTYHHWKVVSVQPTRHNTIVKKIVTPTSKGTYMYSSQDEYIEDADTGRKYYLQNTSLGFEGNRTIAYDTKDYVFYEVYPPLPSTVKRINISSGSSYYVQDLDIR